MPCPESSWQLYVLDCDGRLYTGISTDPERRLEEHRAGGARGARFTRGSKQVELLWRVHIGDRGWAQRAEHRLRKMRRARKLAIVQQAPTWIELKDLLFPESRAQRAP